MGPHNLTPEKVESLSFAPKSSAGSNATKKSSTGGDESSYIGSKNSKVFHRASCRFAATISDGNRIIYNTREGAIGAGKRPCMRCNP
jgi:methylphosphotriester-DNA--protein-cysteine methyltransferase